MGTYREAILHARSGGTAYCGGKEIRLLTREEAEPIILEAIPSRRTVIDEKTSKPLVENGKIVVETFADPNYRIQGFGLYDVSSGEPVPFRPTDEDFYLPVELDEEGKEKPRTLRTDWETVKKEIPETIAPEAVDEALSEMIPDTLGELDEEPL